MYKNLVKKSVKLSLTAVAALALVTASVRCTPGEAAAAGAVGGLFLGGITGWAISESSHDHHHGRGHYRDHRGARPLPPPHYFPSYPRCHQWVSSGYAVQHGPWGPVVVWQGQQYVISCTANDEVAQQPPVATVQMIANVLETSEANTARLLEAIYALQSNRDLSKLEAMGLDKNELLRLAKFELPSNKGIGKLSAALEQDPADTARVLERWIQEAKALKDLEDRANSQEAKRPRDEMTEQDGEA
jgi:hypothetical protein